jgi:hypothetical protein
MRLLKSKSADRAALHNAPVAGLSAQEFETTVIFGEPGWDRTIDPLIKSQMLYR